MIGLFSRHTSGNRRNPRLLSCSCDQSKLKYSVSGFPVFRSCVTQFMANLFTFTELTSPRQSRNADKCIHSAVCGTIETNRFIFIENFTVPAGIAISSFCLDSRPRPGDLLIYQWLPTKIVWWKFQATGLQALFTLRVEQYSSSISSSLVAWASASSVSVNSRDLSPILASL